MMQKENIKQDLIQRQRQTGRDLVSGKYKGDFYINGRIAKRRSLTEVSQTLQRLNAVDSDRADAVK